MSSAGDRMHITGQAGCQLARKHLELLESSWMSGWPGVSSEGKTHHGLGEQDSQWAGDRDCSLPSSTCGTTKKCHVLLGAPQNTSCGSEAS